MGKKNKKAKAAAVDAEVGMPRSVRRECLEIVNLLLDRCSVPFGMRNQEWVDFMEVYDQVEKLRRKQQNYVFQHSKREENTEGFMNWLHENEVNTDCVAIEKFEVEGYGLKAKKEIETAELFLSIPRKVMMSTESAQQTILGNLIKEDRILQSMPNVMLSLHLLCETNTAESFWMPYIKILPSVYSTPLYFSPEEIQLLKGSPSFGDVLNQFRNITRQYAYFFKLFQGYTDASNLPIKNFCYDDYRWAVSTVMTRQNQIPAQGGEQTSCLALIPLWDMCNHCNGQITTDFNVDRDCSECFALRTFDQDDQVFIYYGSRSNAELLIHNGFVYPNNHMDRMVVKMGISKNDPLYSMKAEVLARLALLPSRMFHLHAGLDPVDSDTLAYLRVFSMDHESLKVRMIGEEAKALIAQLKVFDSVVTYEVEGKSWEFLETRAMLLLRSYPTTLEEDDTLLQKPGLSYHKRLAIQLRMGEKRILNTTMDYARKQKMLMHEQLQRHLQQQQQQLQQQAQQQLQQQAQQQLPPPREEEEEEEGDSKQDGSLQDAVQLNGEVPVAEPADYKQEAEPASAENSSSPGGAIQKSTIKVAAAKATNEVDDLADEMQNIEVL